mmetsp:Transcript_63392/g.131875  ORF Transcript_63392/g.131875 Transcript_63392/m.131875 type:complete len:152 (+) Transcript_63392:197-652(+)|eukprot:CAMPEP_0181340940 /NCGR_PEP_ID=MMETSP1101-20121128/30125_1 /TAXON_ID=46948 /ORGANISM="Rhodomonas abbreviata, Strain Caron Lab Isolate" /LENGTH=151 /DNA_ID=CAMNT_0023452145 /DNA_START=191 /DNA_END=646 /DNA_ORIENTATION=-
MPLLEVRIVDALGLPKNKTGITHPDVYATVTLEGVTHATTVCRQKTDAQWPDAVWEFAVADPTSVLTFSVRGVYSPRVGDFLFGTATLCLAGLARGVPREFCDLLSGCVTPARLRVVLTAIDFATNDPAPVAATENEAPTAADKSCRCVAS